MNMDFKKIDSCNDLTLYEALAEVEMTQEDLVSADELKALISAGDCSSWFVFLPGKSVPSGWVAVLEKGISGYPEIDYFDYPGIDNSAHILGTFVTGADKGKGIGKGIIRWIIGRYGKKYLTAAISPENLPSQGMFRSSGFVNNGGHPSIPWELWVKPPASE